MPQHRSVVELTAEDQAVLAAATSAKAAQDVIAESTADVKAGAAEAKKLKAGKEVSPESAQSMLDQLRRREEALRAFPAGEQRDRHIGEVRRAQELMQTVIDMLN